MPTFRDEHWNLGQLIDALKRVPAQADLVVDQALVTKTKRVQMIPTGTSSYRGYYEDLAIVPDLSIDKSITPEQFVVQLESLIGDTMEGYKGGTYRITRATAVWVSYIGDVSGLMVVGLTSSGDTVMIQTKHEDLEDE